MQLTLLILRKIKLNMADHFKDKHQLFYVKIHWNFIYFPCSSHQFYTKLLLLSQTHPHYGALYEIWKTNRLMSDKKKTQIVFISTSKSPKLWIYTQLMGFSKGLRGPTALFHHAWCSCNSGMHKSFVYCSAVLRVYFKLTTFCYPGSWMQPNAPTS